MSKKKTDWKKDEADDEEEKKTDWKKDEANDEEEKKMSLDEHWADVMGFGRYYAKTYSDVYRDDQQYCECIKTVESMNKGFTKFQHFFRQVAGEKQGQNEERI